MPRMVVRLWEDLADGTSTTPILTSHGLTANGSRMLASRVMPAARNSGHHDAAALMLSPGSSASSSGMRLDVQALLGLAAGQPDIEVQPGRVLLVGPGVGNLGMQGPLVQLAGSHEVLVELLAGAQPGEHDLDFLPARDHALGDVGDLHRLAHVEHQHVAVAADGAGLDDELAASSIVMKYRVTSGWVTVIGPPTPICA